MLTANTTLALTAYNHGGIEGLRKQEATLKPTDPIERGHDSMQSLGRCTQGSDMARRRKTAEELQSELAVPRATDDMLKSGVQQFSAVSWMFQMFAQKVPQRTSMRQIYAFTLILEALANGREIIISDLKELAGDDANGEPIFGQSIGRSYQLLMEPTKRDPDSLGWIAMETDENDNRRKLVRLTPKGERMARNIKGYMSGAKPNE